MVRINSLDERAPTLSPSAVRVVGFQLLEAELSAAGHWYADVKLPAYSYLMDVVIHAEELWTAGTTAPILTGLFLVDADGAIAAEEGTNAIFGSIDLLATDLTKGQSVSFARAGGKSGGNLTEGSSTHYLNAMADHDRILRFNVTTTGAVTTALGETYVYVFYALPEMDVPVIAAT